MLATCFYIIFKIGAGSQDWDMSQLVVSFFILIATWANIFYVWKRKTFNSWMFYASDIGFL